MTPHLSVDQVAAFVDRGLAHDERARVEAHLAECDACRSEVVEVGRVMRVRRRRRWFLLIPVAAAAAGLLLVLHPVTPSTRYGIERGGADSSAAVTTIAPLSGAVLASNQARFVWHSVATAASYRLTLTDEIGDVVWTALTGDTALALPDRVVLHPGHAYAWYVDLLLPDGRSSASAVQRFRTAP